MLVLVHFDDSIKALGQRSSVGGETDDGENYGCIRAAIVGTADLKELRAVARVDAVAGGQARIASENAEV